MTPYFKGKSDAIHEMEIFVKNEIEKVKKRGTVNTNSPAQIHDGGRLKALNKVLQKLISKTEKIKNNQR